MFGKLKALINDVQAIYVYIEAHKAEIAQLQKDLASVQKTVKSLTPAKPVKKTTK
jgi:prefoldin subunit 5